MVRQMIRLTYNFLVERIGVSDDWYPLYKGPTFPRQIYPGTMV